MDKEIKQVLYWILGMTGAVSGMVSLASSNNASIEMGSGDLSYQSETTADGFSSYSHEFTTAPSEIGSGGGTMMSISGATLPFAASTTTNGTDGVDIDIFGARINIWEDSSGNIHIGDSTPYSKVEKRAQQAYDAIHRLDNLDFKLPTLIIEDGKTTEAFRAVFGDNSSPDKIRSTLSLCEAVLAREKNHGKNQGIHKEELN